MQQFKNTGISMILIMFKKIASSEIQDIHKLFRNTPKNRPVNKIKYELTKR